MKYQIETPDPFDSTKPWTPIRSPWSGNIYTFRTLDECKAWMCQRPADKWRAVEVQA